MHENGYSLRSNALGRIKAFSFMLGDLLMGTGQSLWVWCIAELVATIPVGILIGGYLADYVMFLCTGLLGTLFSCLAYRSSYIRRFKK